MFRHKRIEIDLSQSNNTYLKKLSVRAWLDCLSPSALELNFCSVIRVDGRRFLTFLEIIAIIVFVLLRSWRRRELKEA